MHSMKRGPLLQRIDGNVNLIVGMFMSLFVAILLCIQMQIYIFQLQSENVEDALAESNLAAAVVDISDYGINQRIAITDFDSAYEMFKLALWENLDMHLENSQVTGRYIDEYSIVEFAIYNVLGDVVECRAIDESGNVHVQTVGIDSAYAPNGKKIENTGVYSSIVFPVKGPFGFELLASKNKLVDVVASE